MSIIYEHTSVVVSESKKDRHHLNEFEFQTVHHAQAPGIPTEALIVIQDHRSLYKVGARYKITVEIEWLEEEDE